MSRHSKAPQGRLRWAFVALCLAVLLGAGCRTEPEFVLKGLALRMTVEETDAVAGKPISVISDGSFSWRWYKGGLVVGFARSATAGDLVSCWMAQTEGGYAEGRLSVGDDWSRAERLFGRAEQSTGQLAVRLNNGEGVCLDILESGGKVAALVLYLAPGEDPDVRTAGYEPGTMPGFRLPKEGGINIIPSAPGTTRTYIEDDGEGGSIIVTTVALAPEERYGRTVVPYRTVSDTSMDITSYFEFTGDIATWVADSLLGIDEYPSQFPSRLYPGLEWSAGNLRYRYLTQKDVTVPAGTFRGAYVVDCFYTIGSYSTLTYYADGIGEVKSDGERELLQFTPGGP